MFSGFVNAGNDEKYEIFQHYIFIESENDPANDPVVMFTNGGPGASTLFGLFVELGLLIPFVLDPILPRRAADVFWGFNENGLL